MKISKPACKIGLTFFDQIDGELAIGVNPNSKPANTEIRLPDPIEKIVKGRLVSVLVALGGKCTEVKTINNAQLVSVYYPEKVIKKETYVHIPNMCVNCNEVGECPISLLYNINPTPEQLKTIEGITPGDSIEI